MAKKTAFNNFTSISESVKDKLPPQNIEAEQSVLGSLMLDKKAIVRIADIINVGDFYRSAHNSIYQAMVELYEKGEPIDLLSLANRLEENKQITEIGGVSYLTALVNTVPTAANVVHYAKIVQRKKTLRDLIDASYYINQLGYQEKEDVESIVDQAEQKVFSIAKQSLRSQEFVPIKATLEEAFERIDRLHRGDGALRGVPTGYHALDNYLAGLQKSDLIIIASRPSLGKTTLALDIARNIGIKNKIPVGIFSIEMAKEQLIDRILCAEADVDLWRLRTGRLSGEGPGNDFERIQQAMDVLSEAPIFIDDAASPTLMQMRTMARRLQAEHGLGLIVVDYLQMIQPSNNYDSSVQQVTEISRGLKTLARELDIPVLALSQLSRAVESRSPSIPRLSDLRESGCLAADTLITDFESGQRLTIKSLAQRKIQKAIKIYALDGNYQAKPHFMTKAFYSGKKMIYQLKTRSGRKIKASANHPFFKLNGWTSLDELKIGDTVALPRRLSIKKPTNPLSKDELKLLAHLIGDGCILPHQPFHYTSADKENIKIVKKAAHKLFGIKARLVRQKNWYHLYLPSPYHLTHDKHHPITNWFRKLGIDLVRSYKKKIPDNVFKCDNNKTALFLKHLWSTDGNLSWKRIKDRKPAASIYYASSSSDLAEQVQHLLLRLGIQSSNRVAKSSKKYRDMHHIHIEGSENQLKFLKIIGVIGQKEKIIKSFIKALEDIIPNPNTDIIPKEVWHTIIQPIKERFEMSWRLFSLKLNMAYCGSSLFNSGLSRQRMMRVYNVLPDKKIYDLANSDIFWDKIISIKKIGIQDVYDATVDGAHNFVANDILVHNSIEQDSDVVLFIYREDKDRPQTDRKNIADIIIAKHRNGPIGKVELYFNESQVSFKNLEKRFEE